MLRDRDHNYDHEPQLGSTASEVLQFILSKNPQISEITYGTYDPVLYELAISDIRILERSRVNPRDLLELARKLEKESKVTVFVPPDEQIAHTRVFAVLSPVQLLGGGYAHIPMMDFTDGDVDQIRAVLKHNGFLLKTDHGFHFWGKKLMGDEEYEEFLHECADMGRLLQSEGQNVFDLSFLSYSIERGCGSLRIFDCEGYKEVVPNLVATV